MDFDFLGGSLGSVVGEKLTRGVEHVETLEQLMHKIAAETPGVEVDYLAVVDPQTFDRPADFHRDLLIVGAVRIGKTRLIDNIAVSRDVMPHTRGRG